MATNSIVVYVAISNYGSSIVFFYEYSLDTINITESSYFKGFEVE